MRILYFGTSDFAIPALQALVDHAEHEVIAVVTQPDRPAGRGGKLTPPPIKAWAVAQGLPVLQPESCRTEDFLAEAGALAPDLSVVAAYGQFLPDALRLLPALGTVNLHGSLLPKYRGAAPIQRAIWQGESVTGVCLMWMARKMDAGDVIACADTPILPEDNAGTLGARLATMAAELLIAWLPAIAEGTAPHHPQEEALVTFAPVIRKEERVVDWHMSAEEIWRQVRALAPSPAAVSTFRGQPVKLLAAQPSEEIDSMAAGAPGTVVEIPGSAGVYVATGRGVLEILILQPAGKRAMSGADFARGYRVATGERFST